MMSMLRPQHPSPETSTAFPNGAAVFGQRFFDSYVYAPELYGDQGPQVAF